MNMAYRESLVFKFADRVVVRFQCEIRLCLKEGGGCDGITPPNCGENKNARLHPQSNDGISMDSNSTDISNATEVSRAVYSKRAEKYRTEKSYLVIAPTMKRRFARSSNTSKSKTILDTDLISQSVYVLDSEEEPTGKLEDPLTLLRRSSFGSEVCVCEVFLFDSKLNQELQNVIFVFHSNASKKESQLNKDAFDDSLSRWCHQNELYLGFREATLMPDFKRRRTRAQQTYLHPNTDDGPKNLV
ncbi:unnamed protein product [Anisakis simplex]|uniref:ZP domain-containing protein n=1 Tax=Anisakis simplex TaxID=6269 RepID=A0A0M3KDA8_ANISI|nr:unnamed protein product [Anisakis simplex]